MCPKTNCSSNRKIHPSPLRLPHLLLRQRRQLHRLARLLLEHRLDVGVRKGRRRGRLCTDRFDDRFTGPGIGRQHPGRSQGNNGVFQLA